MPRKRPSDDTDRIAPGFEVQLFKTIDQEGVVKEMPRNRVAVKVRPGMAVYLTDRKSGWGQVIHCLKDFCIVRGSLGEINVLMYGELDVTGCVPDPRHILPDLLPSLPQAAKARRKARTRPAAKAKAKASTRSQINGNGRAHLLFGGRG